MDKASIKMDDSPIEMAIVDHPKYYSGGKKSSGFPGQRLVVVHPPQLARASRQELLRPFYPTDIGLFRTAAKHERRRPAGSPQTIFIRCVEGRGWCELEGVRYAVGPCDLLVIPARRPHAYGADGEFPWTIEWFHATGSGVPELLRHLGVGRRTPVLALRQAVWDTSLFNEALTSLESGFTDAHLRHAAFALSHLMARVIVRLKERVTDPSFLVARLEKVVAFLHENHAQSLNVEAMASMAGLSVSHFSGLFIKHTGHPPMDYLIRTRIGRACQLLDLTRLSIKETAERVGYADPYYFSRVFKKVTSCSPTAYREVHKG
jgi:AraC-like DNA-binding protein